MKDLLQISTSTIGSEQVNSVVARDIWMQLKSKTQFADWIKNRLNSLGAVQDQDYLLVSEKNETNNGFLKNYIVTLDVAKHLAMMERNDLGKKMRQYFIEVEKTHKKVSLPGAKELALMVLKAEEEKELLQIENKKKSEFISNVVHSENSYTATQVAKDFNISGKLFNKILVESGVIYHQNGTYALTSRYQSYNLTTIKETNPDMNNKTYLSLRWTVAGKNWLKNNWDKALQKCTRETFDQYNQMFLKNLPAIPMPKKSDRNF